MAKSGIGRPRLLNDKEIQSLSEKFIKYISDNEIPIIAEFAYLNDVNRQSLYDYPEFSTLLKKCIDKKESALEKQGLGNKVNTAMAIFSLKQLGWKDRQEVNVNAECILSKFLEGSKGCGNEPPEEPI